MHLAQLVWFIGALGCAGAVESPAPGAEPSTTTPDPGALTGADAPCDVRTVLRTYCVNCHQIAMYYPHAPTLAFTRSELATKDETGLTLAERVLLRLSDAKDPMPPALYGVVPPSDAERRVISDWLTADMPGGECDE